MNFLIDNGRIIVPVGTSIIILIILHLFLIIKYPRSKRFWLLTDYFWYSLAIIGLIFAGVDWTALNIRTEIDRIEKQLVLTSSGLDAALSRYYGNCLSYLARRQEEEQIATERRRGVILPDDLKGPETFVDPLGVSENPRFFVTEGECKNVFYVQDIVDKSRTSPAWPARPSTITIDYPEMVDTPNANRIEIHSWTDVTQNAPGPISKNLEKTLGRMITYKKIFDLNPDLEKEYHVTNFPFGTLLENNPVSSEPEARENSESDLNVDTRNQIIPTEIGILINTLEDNTQELENYTEQMSILSRLDWIIGLWPYVLAIAAALRLTKVTASLQ